MADFFTISGLYKFIAGVALGLFIFYLFKSRKQK